MPRMGKNTWTWAALGWVSPFMRRKMKKVYNKIVRFGAYLSTVNSLGSLPQKLDFLNCNAVFQLDMGIWYHFNQFQISLNFHSGLELGTHATRLAPCHPMSHLDAQDELVESQLLWKPQGQAVQPQPPAGGASQWHPVTLQMSRKVGGNLLCYGVRYWIMYRLYAHIAFSCRNCWG